jgi:hypothetical protein
VKRWLAGAGLLLLVTALGCGGGGSGARVHGRVTLDGAPVDGSIRFVPTDGKTPTAGAPIEGGEYSAEKIPVTSMRVEITAAKGGPQPPRTYDTANPQPLIQTKELIPARYNTKSDLKCDVQRGDNTFNFELVSK